MQYFNRMVPCCNIQLLLISTLWHIFQEGGLGEEVGNRGHLTPHILFHLIFTIYTGLTREYSFIL